MSEYGKTAYEVYREHAGKRSLASGDPLPPFERLHKVVREAWIVTEKAVLATQASTINRQAREIEELLEMKRLAELGRDQVENGIQVMKTQRDALQERVRTLEDTLERVYRLNRDLSIDAGFLHGGSGLGQSIRAALAPQPDAPTEPEECSLCYQFGPADIATPEDQRVICLACGRVHIKAAAPKTEAGAA